jgi:hypothetical protein
MSVAALRPMSTDSPQRARKGSQWFPRLPHAGREAVRLAAAEYTQSGRGRRLGARAGERDRRCRAGRVRPATARAGPAPRWRQRPCRRAQPRPAARPPGAEAQSRRLHSEWRLTGARQRAACVRIWPDLRWLAWWGFPCGQATCGRAPAGCCEPGPARRRTERHRRACCCGVAGGCEAGSRARRVGPASAVGLSSP